jgi:hypothetical protein
VIIDAVLFVAAGYQGITIAKRDRERERERERESVDGRGDIAA